MHHAAQPYRQVQQSRSVSSNDSDSSTKISSSETSSSEESDCDELTGVSPRKVITIYLVSNYFFFLFCIILARK
jgi:hypothetical protein